MFCAITLNICHTFHFPIVLQSGEEVTKKGKSFRSRISTFTCLAPLTERRFTAHTRLYIYRVDQSCMPFVRRSAFVISNTPFILLRYLAIYTHHRVTTPRHRCTFAACSPRSHICRCHDAHIYCTHAFCLPPTSSRTSPCRVNLLRSIFAFAPLPFPRTSLPHTHTLPIHRKYQYLYGISPVLPLFTPENVLPVGRRKSRPPRISHLYIYTYFATLLPFVSALPFPPA